MARQATIQATNPGRAAWLHRFHRLAAATVAAPSGGATRASHTWTAVYAGKSAGRATANTHRHAPGNGASSGPPRSGRPRIGQIPKTMIPVANAAAAEAPRSRAPLIRRPTGSRRVAPSWLGPCGRGAAPAGGRQARSGEDADGAEDLGQGGAVAVGGGCGHEPEVRRDQREEPVRQRL